VGLLDWDHRLPSKVYILRVMLFYDAPSADRFRQAIELRRKEIAARNLYPEFDVADFAGLPADEAYDAELGGTFGLEAVRLVSPWRREIAEADAQLAIEAVRASKSFADVQKAASSRSPFLGDLETVAWSPPCETGHDKWTMEVWWLTAFDGRIGKGWSFLVDSNAKPEERVVTSREFAVRAA
jgi:hypothetical protein